MREYGSAGSSALWDMGVDGVTVPRRCRCGVVGDVVEVYHGVPSNHVRQLRCNVFCGSSLEVLGFLVQFEVVCRVIGRWEFECGWERVGHASCHGA